MTLIIQLYIPQNIAQKISANNHHGHTCIKHYPKRAQTNVNKACWEMGSRDVYEANNVQTMLRNNSQPGAVKQLDFLQQPHFFPSSWLRPAQGPSPKGGPGRTDSAPRGAYRVIITGRGNRIGPRGGQRGGPQARPPAAQRQSMNVSKSSGNIHW